MGNAAKKLSFKSGAHGKEDLNVLIQVIGELKDLLALEYVPNDVRMHLERGWKGIIKPASRRKSIIHPIERLSYVVQNLLTTSVISEERQETRFATFPCEVICTNYT
jgi:hypothetical protein